MINFLLLLLIALIWGSSFILIKLSLKYFEPVHVGSIRVFIAFMALAPALLIPRFRVFKGKEWLHVTLVGLLGSFVPALLFATAQTKIPSSLAAILNTLVPLSTLLIGIIFFQTTFNKNKSAGVLIGIAGSLVIILFRNSGFSLPPNIFQILLVLLAGVCYAVSANILKSKLHMHSPVAITAWSFVLVGPLAGVIALQTGAATAVAENPETWIGLGYLAILAVMSTAVAMILFNHLIQRTSAVFASTVTYLIPIVAIGWGLADAEVIQLTDIIGLLLILLGIYLTGR